jgi:hypothetical protein
MQAVAADGFDFHQWSGTVFSTANPLTLTIESDLVLIAQLRRTYNAWETSQFTPEERATEGLTAPKSDAFGNGIANLAVYAFGLNVQNPERADLDLIPSGLELHRQADGRADGVEDEHD